MNRFEIYNSAGEPVCKGGINAYENAGAQKINYQVFYGNELEKGWGWKIPVERDGHCAGRRVCV